MRTDSLRFHYFFPACKHCYPVPVLYHAYCGLCACFTCADHHHIFFQGILVAATGQDIEDIRSIRTVHPGNDGLRTGASRTVSYPAALIISGSAKSTCFLKGTILIMFKFFTVYFLLQAVYHSLLKYPGK